MSAKQKMCTVMDLPTSILASLFAPLMFAGLPNHFPLLTMSYLKIKSSHFFSAVMRCKCPSGAETDDPEGRCCVFPFTYGIAAIGSRSTYYSCTSFKHDRLWCSLDAEYNGNWANCGKENTIMTMERK